MTAAWAALAGAPGVSLAGVGVVGLGVVVWRARGWVRRRQAVHQAWLGLVRADDREVAQLEACWRLPDYEREEHPNA